MNRPYAHAIGFDDAPFPRSHRGDVLVVGAVHAGARLDGVLAARVRRDGANATERLIAAVTASRFYAQLKLVWLQGIALAGFNVIDIHRLHAATGLPVLVAARRRPNLEAIRRALLDRVPGGRRKWRLIEAAGPMEAMCGIWVQRAGLEADAAAAALASWQFNGKLPEPLRTAHLIAGGVTGSRSRQKA
ncbi:MAG: endonuclease dU [Thiobacillaceae bacterium]